MFLKREVISGDQKMLGAASEEFSTATEIADYLAKKGVPFRKAHEVTGKIVKYCKKKNKTLFKLTIKEWKSFSDKFDSNVLKAIDIKKSIDNKNMVGGTSSKQVVKRIEKLKKVF